MQDYQRLILYPDVIMIMASHLHHMFLKGSINTTATILIRHYLLPVLLTYGSMILQSQKTETLNRSTHSLTVW